MNNFNNYPNGGNPFNRFKASTTHMINNMPNNRNAANFNDSYSQPDQIIEKTNFDNDGHVLHNNLDDYLLNENVVEYHINIDSDDRRIETYPNPFDYTVIFTSEGKSIYKPIRKKNGRFDGFEQIELPETPSPVIMRNFKNVKYVKLDHVILSKYNRSKYTLEQNIGIDPIDRKIHIRSTHLDKHCHSNKDKEKCFLCKSRNNCKFCDCNCESCSTRIKDMFCTKCTKCFPVNKEKMIDDDCNCKTEKCHSCDEFSCKCSLNDRFKFLILKVKELNNNRIFSTNTISSDNTFVLHLDKNIGVFHNIWISRYGTCTFPDSLLFNLNKLSIEFYNNRGEKLRIGIIIRYNIIINNVCHKMTLIFGFVDEFIKRNISNIKFEFPISELVNVKSWYRMIFNTLLLHINDNEIKNILNENYECLLNTVEHLEIKDLIRNDITNNVFFIVGVQQNELNTVVKYER